MPTISDIALRARTSRTAVSYALNGRRGGVGAETRARILKAAEELGYRPNRHARQLRKQASLTISVQADPTTLTSNKRRQTATLGLEVFQGISAYAVERGYHLHLLLPDAGRELEEIHRQILQQHAVDGVAFMGMPRASDQELEELVEKMQSLKISAVTMDRRIGGMGVPEVALDQTPAVRQAAKRLAELGHRRCAYFGLAHQATVQERRPRVDVVREELASRGIELPDELIFPIQQEVDAYRQTWQLAQKDELPSCLIYAGDHHAMAGLKALYDLGLSVPGDVSILSMNNAAYCHEARVPLTTIDYRFHERGTVMARTLLDQIDGNAGPVPGLFVLDAKLIERESVGPAR